MIRIRVRMMAIMLSLFSTTVCAQTTEMQENGNIIKMHFSGGPLVEMNMSGFLHSGFSNGRSKLRPGVSVGGFAKLDLLKLFAVQGEASFQYKQSEFAWNSGKGNFRYWGMEIQILAMVQHVFRNNGCTYIGVGPYTNFGLDARFVQNGVNTNLYKRDGDAELPPMRDSDTGFGAKVGYELPCGLQLNVSWKASVDNVLDANSDKLSMHPQTWSMGVAYRFGK